MTLQEAIEARHSVRAYKDQPLSDDVVKVLQERISNIKRYPVTYRLATV